MLQNNSVQKILTDIDELRELMIVIEQTPGAPEVLYKLAAEKANLVVDAIKMLSPSKKENISTVKPVIKEKTIEPDFQSVPVMDKFSDPETITVNEHLENNSPEEETQPPFILTEESSVKEALETEITVSDAGKELAEISEEKITDPIRQIIKTEERSSVAETLVSADVSLDEVLQRRQAKDLRKAMTLNDKFRFRRELFFNSSEMMNATIDALNEMTSYADSCAFLQSQFSWDPDNQTVSDFMAILEKKFL